MRRISKLVLKTLNESDGHMSAKEIFEVLKNSNEKVSFASVYRVLDDLVIQNKVRKITTNDGPAFFDKTLFKHDHAICSKCGKVMDINLPELNDILMSKVENLIDYDLNIKFICDECKKKEGV